MANFPALKTGAVAQYPSDRTREFSTQVLRFLDGSEQRFPGMGRRCSSGRSGWSLLDESELVNLRAVFRKPGRAGGDVFVHRSVDGTVYPNCSFGSDHAGACSLAGCARGTTSVTVKENRS